MPPPLQFTGAQAAIARNIQQQHNMMAQAQLQAAAQHQQQQAIAAFVGAVRTATPALTAMAGVARSAASQASFGARVGYGAVNYVARNIGSASGSSFLERRLDWALFGIGTTGAGALAGGMLRGIQTGQLSYDTNSGLQTGTAVTNSITYGVLGAIYKATGFDIAGQGALMGAEEQTKMFTGEIARYGGKVTPEFRAWYFDMKAKQEAAALEEQKQVSLYAESLDARGKAGNSKSSSPFSFDNEKFMSVLVSINDTINEVKNLFMNWATKGPTQ